MGIKRSFTSPSPEATVAFARRIGGMLPSGTVLALDGELGSGKTTFMRGLAQGLGISEPVSSPTYTLMHEYHGRQTLFHYDAWMEDRERAFLADGGAEVLGSEGISAIEWAERVEEHLPTPRLSVRLTHRAPEERGVDLKVVGESGALDAVLAALKPIAGVAEVS